MSLFCKHTQRTFISQSFERYKGNTWLPSTPVCITVVSAYSTGRQQSEENMVGMRKGMIVYFYYFSIKCVLLTTCLLIIRAVAVRTNATFPNFLFINDQIIE